MAGIVEFPHVVQEALQEFGDLLPNEPQRRHFAEYLTGLYVAADKNVSAINREFARPRDQSCLNRFLHRCHLGHRSDQPAAVGNPPGRPFHPVLLARGHSD